MKPVGYREYPRKGNKKIVLQFFLVAFTDALNGPHSEAFLVRDKVRDGEQPVVGHAVDLIYEVLELRERLVFLKSVIHDYSLSDLKGA